MYGKIQIKGILETVTGLHIGGSGAFAPIGSVNNPIIFDTLTNLPMIPGSSLKGKMRTLLARQYSSGKLPAIENDHDDIKRLFGFSSKERIMRGRLLFSDMFLTNMKELREAGLQSPTEIKWENTIPRITAIAKPRQNERVVRGAKFGVEWIYEVCEEEEPEKCIEAVLNDMQTLLKGIDLLEYDYLGGNGSRGDGKVRIKDLEVKTVIPGDLPKTLLEEIEGVFKNRLKTDTASKEETK